MLRVLVIDDYQEHIDTLVNTLNMYGCDAKGALTAQKGMDLFMTWFPQLIICDGLQEDKKAWKFWHDVCNQVEDHSLNRPYMVTLTGFGSTLQRRLCEECGSDEYVTKPIELSTLLCWVEKAKQKVLARGQEY
jgi:CheY-like chemotaxis protein